MTAVDIPLALLHPGGDHLPGPMDLRHVLALLDGSYVDNRPLDVQPDGDRYVIRNGRHRYIAALLQGRLSYPCELSDPEEDKLAVVHLVPMDEREDDW